MRLDYHVYRLPLTRVFTISRGSMAVQETVIVELFDERDAGLVGYGEATQHAYYGHSTDSICASLETLKPLVESGDWTTLEQLWEQASREIPTDMFALSALDQAAHDWFGKTKGRSTFELFGFRWRNIAASSVTISLGDVQGIIEELSAYRSWPILKIKLGGANDLEIVETLRKLTGVPLRIDANGAWTVEETITISSDLARLGVELIEQPLPMDASREENEAVYRGSALPVIADESCKRLADVRAAVGCFHGVNIKLSKCGGITPARRMLEAARSLGLKTMIGCMVESEVAISAAAQLLPLLDYVDLDGAALLAERPFEGVAPANGHFFEPERTGNGVRKCVTVAAALLADKQVGCSEVVASR